MISLLDYYKIKIAHKDLEFVVPFLDTDRKFFIDPSLIRESRHKYNIKIETFRHTLNKYIAQGNATKLLELLNIGESRDIGFGYCAKTTAGSGIGREVSLRTIELVVKSPLFRKQGITRIEELQWLDVNIGPDRISDLIGNVIKKDLIAYTKVMAKKYKIPIQKVRVNKIYDFTTNKWLSQIDRLPVNELITVRDVLNAHPPILLLPKEIVRMLPIFLDYSEYYGFIDPEYRDTGRRKYDKPTIRNMTLEQPSLSTRFINIRESQKNRLYRQDPNNPGSILYEKLKNLLPGKALANEYRDLVAQILEYLFASTIKVYDTEVSTFGKENRRDIILSNNGTASPFAEFKAKYFATNIIVDTKNTDKVTSKDVAQVSNYLNQNRGNVGFIVSRKKQSNIRAHQIAQLKDHKKIILHITNSNLLSWIKEKIRLTSNGESATKYSAYEALSRMYQDIEVS